MGVTLRRVYSLHTQIPPNRRMSMANMFEIVESEILTFVFWGLGVPMGYSVSLGFASIYFPYIISGVP